VTYRLWREDGIQYRQAMLEGEPVGDVESIPAPEAPPAKAAGCKKCGQKAEVIKWLGLLWYGKPKPLRLRLQWPVRFDPGKGCGCIVVLKSATLALTHARRQWCQMWSQAREQYARQRSTADARDIRAGDSEAGRQQEGVPQPALGADRPG
jgi:hypothetical protein